MSEAVAPFTDLAVALTLHHLLSLPEHDELVAVHALGDVGVGFHVLQNQSPLEVLEERFGERGD